MNTLQQMLEAPVWGKLGLVLLHFLWQGTLIAGLAWLFLRNMRSRSASERYALACLALLAMAVVPVWTLLRMPSPPGPAAMPLPLAAGPIIGEAAVAAGVAAGVNWLAIVGALWALGMLMQQGQLLLSFLRANQLRRKDASRLDERWQRVAAELSERLGVRRGIRVLRSARIDVPAVVGWIEPVVLIPASALTALKPDELRAVMAHELAHLRRMDPLFNALQSLLESLLFFHPGVWWLSARIREEREYCCDDLAVEVCGNPLEYARALNSLECLRCEESALVLSSTGGSLMHRIQRLVAPKNASTRARTSLATPALFTLLILGLATGSAHAWKSPPQDGRASGAHRHEDNVDRLEQLERRLDDLQLRIRELRSKLGQSDVGIERTPWSVTDLHPKVEVGDFDGDGHTDLYVANDGTANQGDPYHEFTVEYPHYSKSECSNCHQVQRSTDPRPEQSRPAQTFYREWQGNVIRPEGVVHYRNVDLNASGGVHTQPQSQNKYYRNVDLNASGGVHTQPQSQNEYYRNVDLNASGGAHTLPTPDVYDYREVDESAASGVHTLLPEEAQRYRSVDPSPHSVPGETQRYDPRPSIGTLPENPHIQWDFDVHPRPDTPTLPTNPLIQWDVNVDPRPAVEALPENPHVLWDIKVHTLPDPTTLPEPLRSIGGACQNQCSKCHVTAPQPARVHRLDS